MQEWKPPFSVPEVGKNEYYGYEGKGYFAYRIDSLGPYTYRFYSVNDRGLYDINLETREYREIAIKFDWNELAEHEPGFQEESEWLRYACRENAFNTLKGFLDRKIVGNAFDKKRQQAAYKRIAANTDGVCGEKIHRFVRCNL